MGISQDKLGEKIGLDLSVASARISRYESGTHEPTVSTARDIANALGVPLGYLYCDDDRLAEIVLLAGSLPSEVQEELLQALRRRAQELGLATPAK